MAKIDLPLPPAERLIDLPPEQSTQLATEEEFPQEPEVSQFEALIRAMGRGATAEFLDELRGGVAAGAGALAEKFYEKPVTQEQILKTVSPKVQQQIVKTPELKQELVSLEEPKESSLDRLKRLYTEYRDAERYKSELAEEQHPLTTFTGQLVGGAALPVGVAAKGAKLGTTALKGALVGAGYGAATGAGLAETPEQILPEAMTGGKWGGIIGGVVAPVGGLISRKLGKEIKGSKSLQNFIDSYNIVKQEPDTTFIGQTGRKQAMKTLTDALPSIQETMTDLQKATANKKTTLLKQKTIEGQLVDLTENLQKTKNELSVLLDHPNTEISADAKKLLNQIDDILLGKEKISSFKAITPSSNKDVALKKAQEMKKKLASIGTEPQTEETIINKMAETNRKIENKLVAMEPQIDEVVSELGKLPSEFENVSQKSEFIHKLMKDNPEFVQSKLNEFGIKKLPRPTEFTIPKPAIEPVTGQKLIETVDTNTGMSILKATPEKMLTDIEEVIDPVTNQKFLQFVDAGTEQIYRFPIKEDTYTKIVPVIGRSGGSGVMSPTKADQVRQAIQRFTPVVNPNISREVSGVALDAASDMKIALEGAVAGYKDANAAYNNIATAMKNLNLTGYNEVEDIISGLGAKIADITSDTQSGHFHREIMKKISERIKAVNPEIGNKLEQQLNNLATRLDLAFTKSTPGVVAGKAGPTLRTGVAGVPIVSGELSAKAINAISKMKADALNQLSTKMLNVGTDASKKVGNVLSKMAPSNQRVRQSLLFGLMQNPIYRQVIYDNAPELLEEEKE